jgi:hypothetical protein
LMSYLSDLVRQRSSPKLTFDKDFIGYRCTQTQKI